MGFTCGIIGLPNVGKSTIFNALTSAKAAAENFPFCTIEPNTGVVPVPDDRIEPLAKLAKSAKVIPTQVEFVDIAGLIKGASQGEGLGNQFLGHIRGVDAVAHVVRCFGNKDVVHVDGSIDPARDVETIDTELILADLESITRQRERAEKNAKSGEAQARARLAGIQLIEEWLSVGKPARTFEGDLSKDLLTELTSNLLTAKPTLFVANVDEDQAAIEPNPSGSSPIDKLAKCAKEHGSEVVVLSGRVEAEIAELELSERSDYLAELGLEQSGLDRLALAGYRLLDLITFFTAGPKEARAWTAPAGSKAPQCAGKIHTDFERGFIRAEVISYSDYIACGGEQGSKESGKMRVEGKEYVVVDGDVVHFRFNV